MKIFRTINFNIVEELCKDALENSKMVALIGYPGAGKTIALKYFQNNNENVIYSVVRKSMTPKEFYLEILRDVGYEGDVLQSSLFVILNMIIFRIKKLKKKTLLIIDEAGKFKPGQLEYIHEMRDQTIDHLGILLAGPEYFFDNLYNWKERKVIGIPEVFRRLETIEALGPPSFIEIKSFCIAYGITDLKVIRTKFRNCSNFGELYNNILKYLKDLDQEQDDDS
ncbi:ATP-binding protein [uncultured Aquimarina sp.]|uniref:ATP-binding protein n=1 Tax=uncultured Aquimarina sp. TaxID=575652 RepID=UPI0026387ECD|nr:ATP-binding protein [uncultured Aquimarina sp.]